MKRISNEALRDHFLGWQCRIRQLAIRQLEGQPMPAMQPAVWSRKGEPISQRMTVLIIKAEPAEIDRLFPPSAAAHPRACRSPRRRPRLSRGRLFQDPQSFSEEMTALFPAASPAAGAMLAARPVLLDFDQYSQRYRISCKVRRLKGDELGPPGRALAQPAVQSEPPRRCRSARIPPRLEKRRGGPVAGLAGPIGSSHPALARRGNFQPVPFGTATAQNFR